MLILNRRPASVWPTNYGNISPDIYGPIVSSRGALLVNAYTRRTPIGTYYEQGALVRDVGWRGPVVRGSGNTSIVLVSGSQIGNAPSNFAWWFVEANSVPAASTTSLLTAYSPLNTNAILIGTDASSNLVINVEGTAVATIPTDWTRPLSLAVTVNASTVFWALNDASAEVAQTTALREFTTTAFNSQKWYTAGPKCYALANGSFYRPDLAQRLARDPWQLFAPQQIIIPTAAAAAGYTHPTLSLATATEITSTTARGRVTATAA